MSFQFSEEQRDLRDLVRKLADEKVAPGAGDREERGEYPWDMVELFRQHGLFAAYIPKEYGGAGAKLVDECIVQEEISRVCNSCAAILAFANLCPYPIICGGNEEQKRKYLPLMAKGEILGAYALTEPEAGSDAASLKTTAVLDGDEYEISGTKTFISHFDVASICIVYARTNPEVKPSRGISAFVVEKKPGWEPEGLHINRLIPKMGMRAMHTFEIAFDGLRVPRENRLGEDGEGLKIAFKTLDRGRVIAGAQAVGIAQGAFDYTLSYTKKRVQFGKPIASFQGIQWMLADMYTDIEAARQLVYLAASHADSGGQDLGFYGAMAKKFSTDAAMRITTEAVQLLGGIGYTKDCPVERLMRDAKGVEIYEGTTQIQRIVIARHLIGNLNV